ncbi:hypothetical protein G6F56_007727 [Rhizopus delemar]|nr:hypothetical protein G6F56_007727 [Rhizopus delemar]
MSRNYSPEELKLVSQDEIIPKDELYEIEAIIKRRGEPGNKEYLVRWKNYSKDDDSWLSANDFNDLDTIERYWQKLGQSLNERDEVTDHNKENEDSKKKKQKIPLDYSPSDLFTAVTSSEQSKSKTESSNRPAKLYILKNRQSTSKKPEKAHLSEKQRVSHKKTSNGNKRLSSSKQANNYNLRRHKRVRRNYVTQISVIQTLPFQSLGVDTNWREVMSCLHIVYTLL